MEITYKMEENILERNAKSEVILAKFQREMSSFSLKSQHDLVSQDSEGAITGRGLFVGNPPNVRNVLYFPQVWRDKEIMK